MRNASGHQGKNERKWKKKKGAVTCNEEDSRCNNNGKEISKKVCYTCKVVRLFLLIRPTDFFCRSRRRRRLALQDFIFWVNHNNINELKNGLLYRPEFAHQT